MKNLILSIFAATALMACGGAKDNANNENEAGKDAAKETLLTGEGLGGIVTNGTTIAQLPQQIDGVYDRVDTPEEPNVMTDTWEYWSYLGNDHTVVFSSFDNNIVNGIDVWNGAAVSIIVNGEVVDPWQLTVGDIIAAGGKGFNYWPEGYGFGLGDYTFYYDYNYDVVLTPSGVEKSESQSSDFTEADFLPDARIMKVSVWF